MKKIYKDKIINLEQTDKYDNKFLLSYLDIDYKNSEVEVFFLSSLLKEKKNEKLHQNLNWKYAMYSEVYSPKDELEIFNSLFEYAINNNKKIHIVWITLQEELDILEKYYIDSWYLREDVNCFIIDFKNTLVTVSVNIENLIWKGSDYKSKKEEIFFIPPIRESWQNKAMFKWINRGSITGIHIWELNNFNIDFLESSIKEEKILPLTLAKVLNYNMLDRWFIWVEKDLTINY